MIEYKGHRIDVINRSVYVSGPKFPLMTEIPKREGSELISEAKKIIDKALKPVKHGFYSTPSGKNYLFDYFKNLPVD
jgi:hypothetical protein